MTRSDVWERFVLRAGDVVITTPPRSGTTWTQAIVLGLIHGQPGMDTEIDRLSRWIDFALGDTNERLAALDAQTHRRCIKSHTPFDGITYQPKVHYIGVFRHPIDTHISQRGQMQNLQIKFEGGFTGEELLEESFPVFLEGNDTWGDEGVTLPGIVHHYLSLRRWAHLPNVHLMHYADMKRDLRGAVGALAEAIECHLDKELLDRIAESADFSAMKANAVAAQAARPSAVFKDFGKFFRTGTSNQWEGQLSDELVAAYRARLSSLLPEADSRWLEEGDALSG